MTVFQLFIWGCVRLTSPLDGEIMQMNCAWKPDDFCATDELCSQAGKLKIGMPIFSDYAEHRDVEKTRCSKVHVID